jgi:HD-GYP domain-containing protein (c-di-GMP phosphodiesterase class II)
MEANCHAIGMKLQLSSKEIDELSLLSILHDIGKVGVNSSILKKPGALTPIEWEEIKRHPEIGYRIVQGTPELANVAEYILCHHERWDGKGYPQGLCGEEIPLVCRILAVADAFDAMTNDRSYRSAMPREKAIAELEKNAGMQFDPNVVHAFIQLLK